MPKKPKAPPEAPEAQPAPKAEDNILVSAAKVIGSAAGKIASLAGAPPATKSTKVGKLRKKDGHRLPRRQKKAQQKTPASRKT